MYTHYAWFVQIDHPGLVKDDYPMPEMSLDWRFVDCPKCFELYYKQLNDLKERVLTNPVRLSSKKDNNATGSAPPPERGRR